MNDRFTPSINDLSGALTLPLISRLFAEYQSIEKMDVLLQMLTVLFRCGHSYGCESNAISSGCSGADIEPFSCSGSICETDYRYS